MTVISDGQSIVFSSKVLVRLTSLLFVFIGAASAKDHRSVKLTSEPHIVAHIQFDGMSEVDMTLQTRPGGRYYLYVEHSKGEGVSIIDVSKPEKPKAIGIIHKGDGPGNDRMTMTGNLAIVSGRPVASSQGSELSAGDVVIWDLSDPTSPRLIQKFSKVVKWLQDNREFIYVLADDGLWIVSEPDDQPPNSPDSSLYGG